MKTDPVRGNRCDFRGTVKPKITHELLGTAQISGSEKRKLYANGRDFMIVKGHNELMSTRMCGSEEALATMTLAWCQVEHSRTIVL